jgi:hypothetical protein
MASGGFDAYLGQVLLIGSQTETVQRINTSQRLECGPHTREIAVMAEEKRLVLPREKLKVV